MPLKAQVVRPNREPHLMTACKTVVDADVCVGLVRHSFGTSDFHLFPTPTLRQFGRARNKRSNKDMHAPHTTCKGSLLCTLFAHCASLTSRRKRA